MEPESELNLYDVPVMALRPSTRQIIVNELNKKKVLASEEGLPRDWRGLAHLTGLSAPPEQTNPTTHLLTMWEKDTSSNLGLLEQFLGQLDRWDIVDDVYKSIREDAKEFCARMCDKKQDSVVSGEEERVLTYDDQIRLEHGQELQMYDALLLYADQDFDFAQQMVDRLENDFHLKLCLKENLIGGLTFEHQGIMRLIAERCRRVIIIVSRSFVTSPVNRFFVTFAQALAIEQRRRIIIPCMYERDHFELPMEINYLHKLDYNRMGLRNYDFWQLLRDSVSNTTARALPFCSRPIPVSIREMSHSEEQRLSGRRLVEAKTPETKTTEAKALREAKTFTTTCDMAVDNRSSSNLKVSTYKFAVSTPNLKEKKHSSKSPKDFFRKLPDLFRSEASKTKKNKKIACSMQA